MESGERRAVFVFKQYPAGQPVALALCFVTALVCVLAPMSHAEVPRVFSDKRFAALLQDDPYVWETAARLIQKERPDFTQGVGENGCTQLLNSANTDFQDFIDVIRKALNGRGPAAVFVNDWVRRLETAIENGSTPKARLALAIDLESGSGKIAFKDLSNFLSDGLAVYWRKALSEWFFRYVLTCISGEIVYEPFSYFLFIGCLDDGVKRLKPVECNIKAHGQ